MADTVRRVSLALAAESLRRFLEECDLDDLAKAYSLLLCSDPICLTDGGTVVSFTYQNGEIRHGETKD